MPLIGWTWYFLEIVFCKRKWEEDRDTVIEGLKRLSDYPEYMWVSAQPLRCACAAAHENLTRPQEQGHSRARPLPL